MNISELPRLRRNSKRFGEVVAVLVKYNLAPWLNRIKADWMQPLLRSADGESITEMSAPVRVRKVLTELGTTAIKLGQILSTRSDLVGRDIAAELSHLQSGAPADAPASVSDTIEHELGKPAKEVFGSFDAQAFASASIGQVHMAHLPNGEQVVVKVQHQGIADKIQNDLEILLDLAKLAEAFSPELARYRPLALATEFRKTLLAELDFTREQRNATRFAENFADDERIRFPLPHVDCCSPRVLTMDFLDGISLSDREALVRANYDLTDLARRGAEHVSADGLSRRLLSCRSASGQLDGARRRSHRSA